jgi:hypothetical protein
MMLGGILLGRSLRQPSFKAAVFTVLLGFCLVMEAVVSARAIWQCGRVLSDFSFVSNLVRTQALLQAVLWPTVALGLYWLWFRRAISRQRAVRL